MKLKHTLIQWAELTINFWVGCTMVSAACRGCYMFRDALFRGFDPRKVTRTGKEVFYRALKVMEPKRIFTCSWSDFFHADADEWRADAWDVIRRTPWHTWLILTKRPERIRECLPPDWGNGWKHVWLGVTVENMKSLRRIEALREIPAAVRFISAEPLLEPVVFRDLSDFHWLITGGDSGFDKVDSPFRYRPCEIAWLESAIQQAKAAGLSVFVKQLGTDQHHRLKLKDRHGGDWTEWPNSLRIREIPSVKEVG